MYKHRLRRRKSTPASTSLPVKPRPPIHTCSVYERGERAQKPNDKDVSEDNKMRCSAKLWKNSVCIAFLLIPKSEKSELTLFFMKFQTTTVRTSLRFFVHLILPRKCVQTRFKKIETKRQRRDDCVLSDTAMQM